MKIELSDIGKRFNRDWIFKNIRAEFVAGKMYALLGHNGSGKSTLLKVISGHLSPSEGKITWADQQNIDREDIFRHVSLCAPYLDLIEELTVEEMIEFHFSFKKVLDEISIQQVLAILKFEAHSNKLVGDLSSGMKQRLKLVLSILADAPILLLDEPATNLDKEGVEWYHQLLKQNGRNRLVIIASNRQDEYEMCAQHFSMEDWK